MNKEDIDFLISIQDLEQPDFDNACLERENERLNKQCNLMKNSLDEKQERIDKAISLLKRYGNGTFDEDLLKILKGEDNE